MRKRVPYAVKLVNDPIRSGTEFSRLSSNQSLSKRVREVSRASDKDPHFVHAWASSDCKAVSRSFQYGFHLPFLQSTVNIFPVSELQREKTKVRKHT